VSFYDFNAFIWVKGDWYSGMATLGVAVISSTAKRCAVRKTECATAFKLWPLNLNLWPWEHRTR